MINDTLDIARWRAQLQRDGRVQVDDYLQPDTAERLRSCLAQEVPWTLALRDADGARTVDHETYRAMDASALAGLLQATAVSARGSEGDAGFRFVYDSYMMVSAYKQGRDPGLLLHRVLE
ncbi:MAG: hypothetical protein ACREPE_05025, partial [Lysobacter sp.]